MAAFAELQARMAGLPDLVDRILGSLRMNNYIPQKAKEGHALGLVHR